MNIHLALNDEEHRVAHVAFLDDALFGRKDDFLRDPREGAQFFRGHGREEGDVPEEEDFLDGNHGYRIQAGCGPVSVKGSEVPIRSPPKITGGQ